MDADEVTIAAIGCTGPVASTFVRGFIAAGVDLRILARNPAEVARRYPSATVVEGSMADPEAVARAVAGVNAAFLVTPMGMRNDPGPEIEIARSVIDGAVRGGLAHLVWPWSSVPTSRGGSGSSTHGYTDDGPSVSDRYPSFEMTTLSEHLIDLWEVDGR